MRGRWEARRARGVNQAVEAHRPPVAAARPAPGPATLAGVRPTASQGEQLSSRFTFAHKVVLPALWLAVFGIGTVVLLLRPDADRQRTLAFIVALAVGAFTFFNWAFPLKRVVATGEGVLVSNFRREALVPYREIVAIRESKIVNTVTVELGSDTVWGRRFVFRPYPARGLIGSHPAVRLLAERASAARRPS